MTEYEMQELRDRIERLCNKIDRLDEAIRGNGEPGLNHRVLTLEQSMTPGLGQRVAAIEQRDSDRREWIKWALGILFAGLAINIAATVKLNVSPPEVPAAHVEIKP